MLYHLCYDSFRYLHPTNYFRFVCLGVCIIDQMINVLRIQTIYRVFKAYRPHMQAQLCLRLLGYPIDEYFLYCKQYEGNNDMSRGDLPNDDIANGNAHDPSAPTTHVNIKISKKKKKPPASMNTQSVAPHPAILSIISGLLFLQSIEIKVIDASTPANASTTSALFQLDSVLIDLNPHSQLNTQEVSSIIKKINTLVDMTINTKDTIVQSACVYKKEKLL